MLKKLIRILFIVAFVLATLNINAFYAADQSDIIKTIEITNFKKYNDNFYRGSKPKNEDQYEDLKTLGVKTIIDLRKQRTEAKLDKVREKVEKLGLNYISIPLSPMTPPKKDQVNKFFNVVNNPEYQPVYIHCTYGQDRTGLMSALYRINHDNWTYNQAYEEMLDMGYRKMLYWRLKRYLKKYSQSKETLESEDNKNIK